MEGLSFLRYLVRTLALQITPSTYGRIQIFALMKAKEYAVCIINTQCSNLIIKFAMMYFNEVNFMTKYYSRFWQQLQVIPVEFIQN